MIQASNSIAAAFSRENAFFWHGQSWWFGDGLHVPFFHSKLISNLYKVIVVDVSLQRKTLFVEW